MAGVMALLKQAHPTWSVEQLKALAMNTAGHDLFSQFGQTGNKYGVGRVGSGRVDIPAALSSNSIALNDDGSGAVSVSFGAVEVRGRVQREAEDPHREPRFDGPEVLRLLRTSHLHPGRPDQRCPEVDQGQGGGVGDVRCPSACLG